MSQPVSDSRDLDRLDVDELRRFLERRWKLIAGTALACILLAAAFCLVKRPTYTATSQILLDPHRQHVFSQEAVPPDSALDSAIVDSQISIITSTRLLARIVTKENLVDDPEFAAGARPGLLARILSFLRPAGVGDAEQPSLDGIDPKIAPVIVHLFSKVEVARIAKSYVLSVSVSSRDPAKATRLANSIAQTYVEDQVGVRAKSVQQAAVFFEDRLGNLRNQVRASERAVAEFRKAHNLTTTTMDSNITVGAQQLQDLNEQLALAATDTAEKLARYEQAARFKFTGANVETLPEVIRSPLITQLRGQEADLMRREADLSATYGPAFPAIAEINAQRAGLDRALLAEVRRLVITLRNDSEVAKAREDALRKSIAGLTDISGGDNETGVKLRELERTNMANKALFENFLNRAKLTQEQSTFEEPDARLISPALQPTSPTSPKVKLILPVAAVAGLILGLGFAAGADGWQRRAGNRLPTRHDALILGRVPEELRWLGKADEIADYLDRFPGSALAHELDELARKLSGEESGRIVALQALETDELAASVAVGVAVALDRAGRRVLLVDADADALCLTRAAPQARATGLAEVLAGTVPISDAVLAQSRFALLTPGQTRLDGRAGGKSLRTLLRDARGRFDLVVICVPALDGQPSTADAFCTAADGTALVAGWDELEQESFVAAVDRAAEQPNFLGVVLTRTEVAASEPFALAG